MQVLGFIACRGQFHQDFTCVFFVQKRFQQLSLVVFWLWRKDFGKKALLYEKCAHKMLMK